jgi:hypothetical protein
MAVMGKPTSPTKAHEQQAEKEQGHQAKEQAKTGKEKAMPAIKYLRAGLPGGRNRGFTLNARRGRFAAARRRLLPGDETLLVGGLITIRATTAEKAEYTQNEQAQKEQPK